MLQTKEPLHGRGQGHQDHVVGVSIAALPLGLEHAHHLEVDALDLDPSSQRGRVTEQLGRRRGADDRHLGAALIVVGFQEAPLGQPEIVHGQVRLGGAHNGGLGILRQVLHLGALSHLGGDMSDVRHLPGDGLGILARQGDHTRRPHVTAPTHARAHHQQVGAQGGDVPRDLALGPFADGEHDDHRAHSDDNAEHGQGATQLVARQAPKSHSGQADEESHIAPVIMA